uniref:Glutathione s-transferase-like protein isoform x1 n=1 Tax=Triatoma infestans TaxID=30076 RepID=A0A161MMR7_TRIIF
MLSCPLSYMGQGI